MSIGSVFAALASIAGTSSTSTTGPSIDIVTSSIAEEALELRTGIRGRVFDAKTGEALIEASVAVVMGAQVSALTDVDGNYALELPPGTYDLRVFYELYEGRRISGVAVEDGAPIVLDVALTADGDAVEEVVVEAKADTRKEAALIQERKRAPEVSDAISAQEIARAPDSSASDAVKRVVSATVENNKYVLVRGLGGRYVAALVNGVVLPSPEPDEQAIPLDLFPASLLANLTVLKSYGADLPGAFGGGAVKIETTSFPRDLELKVKLGTSGDSSSTFRDRVEYTGGSLDFFGFDDGTRSLPESVPTDGPLVVRDDVTRERMEEIGEDFENEWATRGDDAGRVYPNFGLGLSLGDTVSVGGRRLGYLGTVSFAHKSSREEAATAKAHIVGGEVVAREELDRTTGQTGATIGALLNVGLEASSTDEVNLFSLYTHAGESRAIGLRGYSETDGESLDATRLQFLSRALSFTQLAGRHRFPTALDLELDWQGNFAVARREEPDTRDIAFYLLGDGRTRLKQGPGSGEHFFSELTDLSGGGSASFALPLGFARFELGGSIQDSARTFEARRFRFAHRGDDPAALFLPPSEIFSADRIGPDFSLEEKTLPADSYGASLLVGAAFASADVEVLDPFRIVGGIRVEHSSQRLEPGSPFAITSLVPGGVDRSTTHVVPAANVIWSITEAMNLRWAYSYTLARPQFRELAPFVYYDFGRRRNVSGNPELVDTRIHNADLRWEWFFGETGLFAASGFYKRFEDPIEQVIYTTGSGDLTFANARAADTLGLELEIRAPLGALTKVLDSLRATANLTLLYSRIALDEEDRRAQTNAERPLQGQSPYVANLGLTWSWAATGTEISVLYNVLGPRLSEVGIQGLPDVYERPFHRLDLVYSQQLAGGFSLKASATNLLNQAVEYRQEDVSLLEYRPGVAVLAALEWQLR
jgi:hypothetical protein